MLPAIALTLLLAAQSTPGLAPTQQQPSTSATAPSSSSNVNEVYKVGPDVLPPKLIHSVDPSYSKEARKRKISGTTLVGLIVDASGNPQGVHLVTPMADTASKKNLAAAKSLDDAAIEAVKQYRFSPATLKGKPVPVELHVEVNFRIF